MSETRTATEYRLVGERGGRGTIVLESGLHRKSVEEPLADYVEGGAYTNVRIEKRQVTYGPWTAVEEGR